MLYSMHYYFLFLCLAQTCIFASEHTISAQEIYNQLISSRRLIHSRHYYSVKNVAFSSDDTMLACSSDFKSNIFEVSSGRRLSHYNSRAGDIIFAENDTTLISRNNNIVKLYDLRNRNIFKRLLGMPNTEYTISSSGASWKTISDAFRKRNVLLPVPTNTSKIVLLGSDNLKTINPPSTITSYAYSSSGNRLALGLSDNRIVIYSLPEARMEFTIQRSDAYKLALNHHGTQLAAHRKVWVGQNAQQLENQVSIVNIDPQNKRGDVRTFCFPLSREVYSLAFSNKSDLLALGLNNGTVCLLDLCGDRLVEKYFSEENGVATLGNNEYIPSLYARAALTLIHTNRLPNEPVANTIKRLQEKWSWFRI